MKQILLVEDDNLLNKTLTYNLELDGYTITSVLNARTAAESLKTNIFDWVLLDINLPDGNGYDPVSYTHLRALWYGSMRITALQGRYKTHDGTTAFALYKAC